MQKTGGFACNWPPVACNTNKIGQNLHATASHAGTICMRLAATRVQFACEMVATQLQDKRQADKWCVKRPSLHHNYIFLAWALGKSTSSAMLLNIQLTALGYLVWKMR
jgi:hypothetical protein